MNDEQMPEPAHDPRDAEPIAAPPIHEGPSTTGLVADDHDGDDAAPAPSDQQTALEQAVERGDPDGSAAAGA